MWGTFSSQEEVRGLCQPWPTVLWIPLLGKEKWKATTAKTLYVAVGGGKEMFLAVNWFATVTRIWF